MLKNVRVKKNKRKRMNGFDQVEPVQNYAFKILIIISWMKMKLSKWEKMKPIFYVWNCW